MLILHRRLIYSARALAARVSFRLIFEMSCHGLDTRPFYLVRFVLSFFFIKSVYTQIDFPTVCCSSPTNWQSGLSCFANKLSTAYRIRGARTPNIIYSGSLSLNLKQKPDIPNPSYPSVFLYFFCSNPVKIYSRKFAN